MTTIIVVAIVALVFFVTVCVVTFMTWKRETEIRTDSIKAIERTMNDMANEIAGLNVDKMTYHNHARSRYAEETAEVYSWADTKKSTVNGSRNTSKKKKRDPFSWMRPNKDIGVANDETVTVFRPMEGESRKLKWTEVSEAVSEAVDIKENEPGANAAAEEQTSQEIEVPAFEEVVSDEPRPSASESISLSFVDLEELDNWEDVEFFKNLSGMQTDYNMGRSGRKYTAEELEELIKE